MPRVKKRRGPGRPRGSKNHKKGRRGRRNHRVWVNFTTQDFNLLKRGIIPPETKLGDQFKGKNRVVIA